MRGLEGHVVLNCTEKPKSADYKKLGLNGTNASRNLRFEVEEEKVGNDTLNDKSNTPMTAMKQIEIKEMEPIMGDVENKMDIVDNDEEFDPNNAKVVRSVVKRLL